jgi:hypothetical protein
MTDHGVSIETLSILTPSRPLPARSVARAVGCPRGRLPARELPAAWLFSFFIEQDAGSAMSPYVCTSAELTSDPPKLLRTGWKGGCRDVALLAVGHLVNRTAQARSLHRIRRGALQSARWAIACTCTTVVALPLQNCCRLVLMPSSLPACSAGIFATLRYADD